MLLICLLAYLLIFLILKKTVKTVNSVDILILSLLICDICDISIVLLHIPLGITTFSFHCTFCMCMWRITVLNLESWINHSADETLWPGYHLKTIHTPHHEDSYWSKCYARVVNLHLESSRFAQRAAFTHRCLSTERPNQTANQINGARPAFIQLSARK